MENLPFNAEEACDPSRLGDFARQRRERFRDLRKASDPAAHEQLVAIKRAETLADLTRGVIAGDALLMSDTPIELLRRDASLAKDFDAGLKKLFGTTTWDLSRWSYQFAAQHPRSVRFGWGS